MKSLFVIIILTLTKCQLTIQMREESTTGLAIQIKDMPSKVQGIQKNYDRITPKIPIEENRESRIYLEDVLFALKNQNWTADEEPCLNQTLVLIESLQNFTLWAVFNWDSISSQPLGLLYGNRYQLGNFDECLKTPWSNIHPELTTQYCLSEIVLERTDHFVKKRNKTHDWRYHPYGSVLDYLQYRPPHTRAINELTWGVCVPANCGPRSVERLLATMLARSHLGVAGIRPRIAVDSPCQKMSDSREYDALFFAFFGILLLLTTVCIVSTILNIRRKEHSTMDRIIKIFCLKENASNLLIAKEEGTEVLYGIRFFTICFIVMDHQIGIINAGPISNGLEVDHDVLSVKGMFVIHDDLFVDTYFFLSGFLLATAITKYKRLPNVFILILKRYIRLSVGFAVVIFYLCAVYPYTGSGPLWNRIIAGETENCRQNWWLNLLMLNNYIDSEHICLVISWYIPCDFHFFVVTILVYWIYKNSPRLGLTCAGVLAIASIVVPAILNYLNKLPPVQLFTYDFVADPRASEQFHVTYIKSHARYAAYVVGFASGLIFFHYGPAGNIKIKKWSVLGACVAMMVMLIVMINGATFLWREYNLIEGILYAAFNRPIWACGVALLVFCCSWGHVPVVKQFLTWSPWVPLSRLTYGVYLTHTIFITRNVFVARSPRHFDALDTLNSAAGTIFWSCVSSFLIWLLAEAPANNLFQLWISSMKKDVSKKEEKKVHEDPNTITTISSSSNDNLPSTIYFSKI
ncbi:nose resistant to fluoxetine protein 6-like [Galleria mellonella]|uniref:Nose resistant to fluoxetine protein 6-like n=1 Tax=Galleria mellonella TaxID=7137 RepID=A0A6J3CA56_GALME|nr:nose resistant to fluoxetine protein 6-like [Galleria mellonella]